MAEEILSQCSACIWEAAERREEGAWHMRVTEVLRREGGVGECSGAGVCAGAAEPAGAEGQEVSLYWCLPLRIVRLRMNERGIVYTQEGGNAKMLRCLLSDSSMYTFLNTSSLEFHQPVALFQSFAEHRDGKVEVSLRTNHAGNHSEVVIFK
ncbi:uncharacterized protein MONOS_18234 [Monocercomonoides exilis]|uniref:uncharacterized protein n=1 Tax=Monocercomonoides exilis TaxID=2049356 RepID=UPI00355A53A2|nr:hypothetical protein MONOS_18234 [Monocercomonoides exilis]